MVRPSKFVAISSARPSRYARYIMAVITATAIESAPFIASANPAYDKFRTSQYQNFAGDKAPESCPLKKLQVIESGQKIFYELCVRNSQPIYLKAINDDIVIAFYTYRQGQLIQVYNPDHFSGVGFRQQRPVVAWNDEQQTINWQLSQTDQRMYRSFWLRSQQILKKFGLR